MTTTAPSTDAPRLTDEDTLLADVEDAIARAVWNCGYGCVSHSETAQQAATEALAAAEPHLRARHRAELFAELSRALVAKYPSAYTHPMDEAWMWGRFHEWLAEFQQADATRPVEGRGVK